MFTKADQVYDKVYDKVSGEVQRKVSGEVWDKVQATLTGGHSTIAGGNS